MIKENKKLKDLTYDEYANFKCNICGYNQECNNCPFRMCNCESPDSKDSWFNNKEMYLEGFLEQLLPVEKELLDEEDRRYLTNMYNLINVRNYEIYTICKCVDSFLGKKIGFISITFKSNVEDFKMFHSRIYYDYIETIAYQKEIEAFNKLEEYHPEVNLDIAESETEYED